MAAFCNDRTFIRALADDACKRNALEKFFVIIVLIVFCSLRVAASFRDNPTTQLLAFGTNLPFSVQLPALFVVLSSVKKFAGICATVSKSCTNQKRKITRYIPPKPQNPVCFQSLHTSGAKSMTVTVRTLVGALIGPNCLVGALGFFWMNDE